MGAAALNDAIAWCLLVLALSIVHSGRNKLTALFVFLAIAAYAICKDGEREEGREGGWMPLVIIVLPSLIYRAKYTSYI